MTITDYRDLVYTFVQYEGKPPVDWTGTSTALLAAINRHTREFCELALPFFRDNLNLERTAAGAPWNTDGYAWRYSKANALTATWGEYGGPPVYDILNPYWYEQDDNGWLVFLPVSVIVGDNVLKNLAGKAGPITVEEMQGLDPYGATAVDTAEEIEHWCFLPPKHIRLWPPPSANFNVPDIVTGVIAGYCYHPLLTTFTPGAGGTMLFTPRHEYVCAVYTAARQLLPRGQGSAVEKMRELDETAAGEMRHMIDTANEVREQLRLGYTGR